MQRNVERSDGLTATEINERQMEAMHKMYIAMDLAKPGGDRTIVGVSYFKEFVDRMNKDKEAAQNAS